MNLLKVTTDRDELACRDDLIDSALSVAACQRIEQNGEIQKLRVAPMITAILTFGQLNISAEAFDEQK